MIHFVFHRYFDHFLLNREFQFGNRNRRPPLDPVNAMLSFGYTILQNLIEATVNIVGLDPYLGSLHAPQSARASLACDLIEEFRAPIVDALVIAALNHKIFDADDFETSGEGEAVFFERSALSRFLRIFQERLTQKVFYPPLEVRLDYRGIIEQQARLFARSMLQEDVTYHAFVLRG